MVAVVMGGTSAGSRDARMRELISQTVTAASTKRTAPMVAELSDKSEPKVAAKIEAKADAKVAKIEVEGRSEGRGQAGAERRRLDRSQGRRQGPAAFRCRQFNVGPRTAGRPPARPHGGRIERADPAGPGEDGVRQARYAAAGRCNSGPGVCAGPGSRANSGCHSNSGRDTDSGGYPRASRTGNAQSQDEAG